METLDQISMMISEDIDFNTLSEELLIELALAEDPFIATEALGELRIRENTSVKEIAVNILNQSDGDVYLKSYALDALLEKDQAAAISYIDKHVKSCNLHLFNSIIKLLIENQSNCFSNMTHNTLNKVSERLDKYGEEEELDKQVVNKFRDTYSKYLDEISSSKAV